MRKPKRLTFEQLAPYSIEGLIPPYGSTDPTRPLDWPLLFGNDRPVEVEVGFGQGLFLLNEGTNHPERNYFGIEIVRKYQLYAATRIATRQLPNVKTCCADAKRILDECIRPDSVDVVHVYFPDPWWKNRHKKRLLFTPEFARIVLKTLKPNGELSFASDVSDYFAMVTETLAAIPELELLPPPTDNTPQHDMDYLTNFERKFRKEGRPIYRSRYRKRV